jgi:hypothetical protein
MPAISIVRGCPGIPGLACLQRPSARFVRGRARLAEARIALAAVVNHDFRSVARAGTDDTQTVMKAMRAAPIHDARSAGRAGALRSLSDVGEIAGGVPVYVGLSHGRRQSSAPEAFRPPGAGGCTLAAA